MPASITRLGNATRDPQHWTRLNALMADALRQDAIDRAALLRQHCGDDAELTREAEALLDQLDAVRAQPGDAFEDCAENATRALWDDDIPCAKRRVGAYEIVRELGRGGMGAVYLAERADGAFQKQVAIKILKRGTDTDDVLQRFGAERHILARLDHPNIARLLDAGTTDDGLPYFVMEYVAGAPVTRFVREREFSIEETLEVFLKICAAVVVAHRSHVIHRDLKPSNILVNSDGEPKLLDFGIAKLVTPGGDDAEQTAAGQELLTPICASPEQTDGRPITEASDVYALGALLYEMLTGEKPHQFSTGQPSREEVARVVREQEPPPPSAVTSDTPRGALLRRRLDSVVMKAPRKDPAMRYPTVAELAADIRRPQDRGPMAGAGVPILPGKPAAVSHRSTRVVIAGLAVLVLVALAAAFWTRAGRDRTAAASSPVIENIAAADLRKSIAVLPFDNFGNDNAPSYFADGVQDNILTDLGKVGGLKVISRSGVAGYRGKTRDVKEIGRALGVGNILEGSVQASGDRVRINARLIDTATDTQIWADHYDRKIEDIFALQSELAQTIVAQLKTTLSSGERAAISKRPTEDLRAYDFYLRARAALNNARGAGATQARLEAVKMLESALALDPKFTLAYCLLSQAHVYLYRFGDEHSQEHLAAAKRAVDDALRLEPNAEEPRLSLARYLYHGVSDNRATREQLAGMRPAGPHEVEFYTLAGLVERRLGLWEEAIRDGEKAEELDPQNPRLPANLADTLISLRRYADAERVVDAAIHRLPAQSTPGLWLLKKDVELARGDVDAAKAALDAIPPEQRIDYEIHRVWLLFFRRDFAAAREVADRLGPETKKTPFFQIIVANIARSAGQADEAREAFEEARRRLSLALENRPDDPTLLSALATVCSGLGQKEDALRAANRAAELRPPSEDAVAGPDNALSLAQVLAWTGDHEGAFEVLGKIVKVPFGPSYGDLKLSPMWDDLRSDPRFDQLLAEAKLPFVL